MTLKHRYIETAEDLREYCESLRDAEIIAFDTEFVSEDCYRPELCLAQVSANDELAIIDGIRVGDLTPFWEVVVAGRCVPITHAGRAELLFCQYATSQMPARHFDVQVAAGFVGMEYPASYANLVERVLGRRIRKSETRSDWRKRPLSSSQLQYALQDVVYLPQMYATLHERLEMLERLTIFREEVDNQLQTLLQNEIVEPWNRLVNPANFPPRAMAVLRELWKWRDRVAAKRNLPSRFVLRDDLLVELARRENSNPQNIRSLRGMQRRDIDAAELGKIIERGLAVPKETLPPQPRNSRNKHDLSLLGQFLFTAFGIACRERKLAPGLVGSVQDVRALAAWYLEGDRRSSEQPKLLQGWRGEVVGKLIEEMLKGKWAISVDRPDGDQPLKLFRI